MCGRLANDLPPELIQRIFSTSNPLPNLRPSWNVAPTMDAPVVRLHPETRERHLDLGGSRRTGRTIHDRRQFRFDF